jgi:pilus assembly protein CpaE
VVELPKFWGAGAAGRGERDVQSVSVQRVGVVTGSIGGPERFTSLAALFPNVQFVQAGPNWPDPASGHLDVLIAPVDAAAPGAVDEAVRQIKAVALGVQVVVVLRDADVGASRRLVREGAADVLPAPVSEPALALCLERLLSAGRAEAAASAGRRSGQVVAFLKAGGGVGATTLVVQAAAMLAARNAGRVGVVDLDLQFGAVGLYLDLPDAVTISDCLAAGGRLEDTPFETALTTHRSGARVLAAPPDMMPMEVLAADQVESLLAGLRRDFSLVLIDLPSVWTAWSNRLLELADRIVLVSQLTVPHVNLVKRQLSVLSAQGLGATPLTLVCNALSRDQQAALSLKAAERSIGRAYDVVVPEDRRLVNAAVNQGLELSGLRRGTQVEKAVTVLATVLAGGASADVARPRR